MACTKQTAHKSTGDKAFHKQLIAILTNAVERAFFKSPRFDMRQLLGGTAPVLQVGATLTLTLTLALTRVYLLDEGLTEP